MLRMSFLLFCVIGLLSVSSTNGQDIEKAWKSVFKNCSSADIVGKNVLFFGPSNTIGVGSVWRKTAEGGYNPRFELANLVKNASDQEKLIKPGEKLETCKGGKSTKWSLSFGIPFIGKLLGQTGSVGGDFRNAKLVTVEAEGVALDVLIEVPFEQAVQNLVKTDPQNAFLKDLFVKDRLIVTKAYRVRGLTVKFDYDPKDLEALKGKYPAGGGVSIGGDKGIKAEFNYSGTSNVTIKLSTDVFIFAEFSRILNGSINLNPDKTKVTLIPVKISSGAKAGTMEQISEGTK